MKERLFEETTKLKRVTEESDSYVTAVQVLTKEMRVDDSVALSSNADQTEINFAETIKCPILNSRPTGQKIPVIATQNRFERLQDKFLYTVINIPKQQMRRLTETCILQQREK